MTVTWRENESRLTPDSVREATFPLSRLGRRGYDEDAVRDFMHNVEQELVKLLNEKVSLWNEVERLRKRIATGIRSNGNSDGVLFGKDDAHVHAVRILSTAQLTADRYVADAQAYSLQLTEEARMRRDEVLNQAQEHAEMILAEASDRAKEAALAALNSPADSPHLQAGRQTLQAELAYLRTFGEVYRTHLRAYTEGMLRSIEEWELREAKSIEDVGIEMAAAPHELASPTWSPRTSASENPARNNARRSRFSDPGAPRR